MKLLLDSEAGIDHFITYSEQNSQLQLYKECNLEVYFTIDIDNCIIKLSCDPSCFSSNRVISDTLFHTLNVYGYRPPYPFTIFKDVYRLLPGMPLQITDDIPVCVSRNLSSINDEWSLDLYADTLIRSIQPTTKSVVVFMSSGWDSSSILAILKEYYLTLKLFHLL